jgi:intracellular multiplication protein IcmJ
MAGASLPYIEMENVVNPDANPASSLGSNFDRQALPVLTFSSKSKIWGDKSGKAIEPISAEFEQQNLRRQTLSKNNNQCWYCQFRSAQNQIHNINDNHNDIRPENLKPADPLCHGWRHLGEFEPGDAAIAYLPGLSGQDVNHLQRTIMVALQSDDEQLKRDAKIILNWLASHRDYTKLAWGTYETSAFAAALVRGSEDNADKREIVFEDLTVIFNPKPFAKYVAAWTADAYAAHPIHRWGQVYHDVINAPI